jgi:hypothetical protein
MFNYRVGGWVQKRLTGSLWASKWEKRASEPCHGEGKKFHPGKVLDFAARLDAGATGSSAQWHLAIEVLKFT